MEVEAARAAQRAVEAEVWRLTEECRREREATERVKAEMAAARAVQRSTQEEAREQRALAQHAVGEAREARAAQQAAEEAARAEAAACRQEAMAVIMAERRQSRERIYGRGTESAAARSYGTADPPPQVGAMPGTRTPEPTAYTERFGPASSVDAHRRIALAAGRAQEQTDYELRVKKLHAVAGARWRVEREREEACKHMPPAGEACRGHDMIDLKLNHLA